MKSINFSIMLVLIFLGTIAIAQTTETITVPKWIIEANNIKVERATKDLNLTEADAAKYAELSLQSTIKTTERINAAATEEEKKAIRADEAKLLKQKIKASFPEKLGVEITNWTNAYWGKYLKK